MIRIQDYLKELEEVAGKCVSIVPSIEAFLPSLVETLKNNGRVMSCGNGGSAADALHFAEEFTGRYRANRKPLSGICLNADAGAITCIANDWDYDAIFSRQVRAHGRKGDFLVCFTTSGNSQNCLNAIEAAKKIGVKTLVLTGKDGGKCKGKADFEVIVPSSNTARIQEMHGWILHVILEAVEAEFPEEIKN
jgi:D-sedoheptulose 7-phosphate isomerase